MTAIAWTPPDNPDPFDILHTAVDDTRDGLHERALAKFLWFHHNALRYDRALSAVRLSFALGYWWDLAEVYPPARDAFIRTRDETEATFRRDHWNFDLFHDIASLNRQLGEELRTADLFKYVAELDHDAAQRLYHVAERHLIAVGRFHICEPFLDPERRMAIAEEGYRMMQQHEDSTETDVAIPKHAREHYIRNPQ